MTKARKIYNDLKKEARNAKDNYSNIDLPETLSDYMIERVSSICLSDMETNLSLFKDNLISQHNYESEMKTIHVIQNSIEKRVYALNQENIYTKYENDILLEWGRYLIGRINYDELKMNCQNILDKAMYNNKADFDTYTKLDILSRKLFCIKATIEIAMNADSDEV